MNDALYYLFLIAAALIEVAFLTLIVLLLYMLLISKRLVNKQIANVVLWISAVNGTLALASYTDSEKPVTAVYLIAYLLVVFGGGLLIARVVSEK
jgi:hypothetical protein